MYARVTSNDVKSLLPGPGKFVCVKNCGPNPVWVYTAKSAKNTAPIRILPFASTVESVTGGGLLGWGCSSSVGLSPFSPGSVETEVFPAASVESRGDSAKRGLATNSATAHAARIDLIAPLLWGAKIDLSFA